MSRFGAIMLGVTLMLLGSGLAEATENATGPVRVDDGDTVVCIAANAGAGNVNNVIVDIQFSQSDGSYNGTDGDTCATVAPLEACPKTASVISSDFSAFCEVRFPSGKIRGTLCNLTKHLCSDTR
jgi:hypothetical protein